MSRNCPTYRGRPQEEVQVIQVIHDKLEVGYLGDMLSGAGGCELSTAHVNRLDEIQGAAACSLIPPGLLQDSCLCVQLMFPECNASCKRDSALDKARSTAFTVKRQSHD